MAKVGNHGIVIPRDRELLHRIYWIEGKTLTEMGLLFGVTHKSMERVFRQLDIPRRGLGVRQKEFCIDCLVVRPKKLPHKLTKNGTGNRCHECLKKYKRQWQQQKSQRKPEEMRAKRKEQMDRWYAFGPLNPKGETQWIRTSRALLRTTKRLLLGKMSPAHLQSLKKASAPVPTSQT